MLLLYCLLGAGPLLGGPGLALQPGRERKTRAVGALLAARMHGSGAQRTTAHHSTAGTALRSCPRSQLLRHALPLPPPPHRPQVFEYIMQSLANYRQMHMRMQQLAAEGVLDGAGVEVGGAQW